MRYQARDENIVWEVVDEEILLMDLRVGIYYSIRGATVLLAHDLLQGFKSEEIIERFKGKFPEVAEPELKAKLAETSELLLNDELLVLRVDEFKPSLPIPELTSSRFEPIEKYDDMQEIFEMDPIHDGDTERGWPVHA